MPGKQPLNGGEGDDMKMAAYTMVSKALIATLLLGSTIFSRAPFVLHVVDARGEPVEGLTVRSDNGIVCYTYEKGDVTWPEPSLMNRRVTFAIKTPGYKLPDGKVLVVHGRHAQVTAVQIPPVT